MGVLSREEVVRILRSKLNSASLPDFIKAVLLFGSIARDEAHEKSDIDLLVLHEDMDIKDPVYRRRYLYKLVMNVLDDVFDSVTLIDMEFKEFIKPNIIRPLLLNIYWDAIVIIDKKNTLIEFLKHIRKRIKEAGLVRVKDGRTYYWILPNPMQEVRLL